jgi:transposase InsO family protein
MSQDDVLFGYRLQLFDLAGRIGVTAACRTFGVHRSTYYEWKRKVERQGLEMLRPRERRRPRMPNQLSPLVEERIVAFALGHPGFGPRRISSELRRLKWGGIVVSANGVWRCLCRHGLNTRAKRLALIAGYRAPYQPPREPQPERHIEADHPGELVGFDCFYVGRLHGTRGTVWQLTAIDVASSYAWADLVACPSGQPAGADAARLVERVARELQQAGWRLERALTDNGQEWRSRHVTIALEQHHARVTRIRAGRPQTNGHVEALHRLILEECWRPAFARYLHLRFNGIKRELAHYLHTYNHDRVHHGRLTRGRIPAHIVHAARKMEPR